VFPDVQLTIVTGDKILGTFDRSLREYTEARFRRERIRVRAGVNATRVDSSQLHLSDGSTMNFGLLIWNTGIGPRKLVQDLDAATFAKDRWGHLVTDTSLRVLAAPPTTCNAATVSEGGWKALRPLRGVYAMGDCASVGDMHYAATAQVAEQQGRWLAHTLTAAASKALESGAISRAEIVDRIQGVAGAVADDGKGEQPVFEYKHRGTMAFVGRFGAVANFRSSFGADAQQDRGSNVTGPAAFALWRSAYLTQLGSWRNRLQACGISGNV
jgi:NADH:ubiquinone reductase (non-electrogenic)